MSKTVIAAEGLGKSYMIGHQQKESYSTLRDVLTNLPRQWWSRLRNPQYHTHENIEEFWALKDVDFEIKQGERVGIIGPNGAGKSTLLKILSRITEPTTGRVKINGRIASLLEVGTGFHPELTGRENIFLNGAILGMSRADIKKNFDEIVAFAEVEKFLDTPVKRYSSGMYVRLAFAVAAHLEPEILIVDEVLAVGDVQFQKKCLGKMKDIGSEGRTVIFVSHNMGVLKNLCQRALLLQDGCVKFDGSAEKAISEYMRSNQENIQKLSDRQDRKGSGELKFTRYSFEDIQGNIVANAICGMPLKIKIYYEAKSVLKKINVGIKISSNESGPVALLASPYTESSFDEVPTKGCFVFYIPKLPLGEGMYLLDLASNSKGKCLDRLTNAISLKVDGGDFFNTGRPDTFGEKFMIEHKITVEND